MKKITTALLATLLIVSSAFAGDIITLNDNKSFEGKVTKIKNCSVVFKADGEKFMIPATDIFSIQFEDVNDKVYTNYLALSDNAENCLKGRTDAESFHGKEAGHFILGVLFGPFAMLGTLVSNPTPERGKNTYMNSENRELFSDPAYLKCYKNKAKGKLIGMEALGWGAYLLIILLL